MLLTKKQYEKKKNCNVKAHNWFGSDFIKTELSKYFDVYINEDNTMFYIFGTSKLINELEDYKFRYESCAK